MNVGKVLAATASRYPDKTAVVHRERRATFSQLEGQVSRLAFALKGLGLAKGNRAILLLPNCYEFVPSYLAILKAGGIAVPVDARVKEEELKYMVAEVQPRVMVAGSALYPVAASALSVAPSCQLLTVGKVEGQGIPTLEEMIAGSPNSDLDVFIEEEDEALYLYTSGTTGRPKAVVLCCYHLDLFPEAMAQVYNINDQDIVGCLLPMSHISGPILINELIVKGSALVICDDMRPDAILGLLAREQVSWFHAVPPIFQILLQVPEEQKYDLSRLRLVAMMGTTIPVPLQKEFAQRYPHVAVIQGYGLTETSPLLTLVHLEDAERKLGSIGKAVPKVELKLVDNRGQEVPVGEMGEIVARGPCVMKGYFNDPEATAEVIKNGWFHTGDLGRQDPDGYLYHVGRKKELIIVGGLNVHPVEVESVLLQNPKVAEAAVVGIPDRKRGEAIKAVIVVKGTEKLTKKELLGFCREKLANFKVPQIIEFRTSLPKTATGKVIKEELVEKGG